MLINNRISASFTLLICLIIVYVLFNVKDRVITLTTELESVNNQINNEDTENIPVTGADATDFDIDSTY